MIAAIVATTQRVLKHPLAWMAAAFVAIFSVSQLPAVAVERCVDAPIGMSWLGLHLSLLRETSTCASGLAAGAPQGQVLGVVVMVTVPVLLANLALAVTAIGGLHVVAGLIALVWAFAHTVWHRVPSRRADVVVGRGQRARVDQPLALRTAQWASSLWGRGPPQLLPA